MQAVSPRRSCVVGLVRVGGGGCVAREFRKRVTAPLLIASHVTVCRYVRAMTWLSIILTLDKPRGTAESDTRAPRPSAPAILQQINSSRRVTSGDRSRAGISRLCEAFFPGSLRGGGGGWKIRFRHPPEDTRPRELGRARGTGRGYVKHPRATLTEMRARYIIRHLHKP